MIDEKTDLGGHESHGGRGDLGPTLYWSDTSLEVAGVYMRDGQARYTVKGRDATDVEFRAAVTDEQWQQAQAYVASLRK